MATFQKYNTPFNSLLKSDTDLVGRYLTGRGAHLTALAKVQVGVDTGALKSSIRYELKKKYGSLAVIITAHDKKAMMHHEGTRPHIIVPKKAKTLRFQQHGRIVYAQVVHHPGTKPNKFLTDNLPKVI